jgi:hypothetical protein
MSQELLIGATLLVIAAGLIFIGLPNKDGVSPRFLQFEAALVLYPPVIMIFLAGRSKTGQPAPNVGLERTPPGSLICLGRLPARS